MKNKYLVRSRRYERQEPLRDSRKIYIYCEGNKREFDYFRFFCGLSSNVNIIPIPSKDGTLDVSQHDNVWFVIDTDLWGSKITDLRNFCNIQNAGLDNETWFVSQSNPCFEIWLYYHKFSEKPVKNDVDKYSSIKEFVDAQIPGGFDSRKHPAMIEVAIQNAKATYEEENQALKLYSTEVFKLGQVILPFVKDIL